MNFLLGNVQKTKRSHHDISNNPLRKPSILFARNIPRIRTPRKILMFGITNPKVSKEIKSPILNDLIEVENQIIEKNDELEEEEYEDESNVDYYEEDEEDEEEEEEEEEEEAGEEEEEEEAGEEEEEEEAGEEGEESDLS